MSIEEQQEAVQEMHLAQQIAEHVARILMSAVQPYPEFGTGGVPMAVAAEVYGKDAAWVREGIDAGWLPIGRCTKRQKNRSFYISPKKLWEDTGFVWKGGTGNEQNLQRGL